MIFYRLNKALITGLLLALAIFANSATAQQKLIFLDVDGVLNNSTSDITSLWVMDDQNLLILSTIIKATGASIVLSSTWRYTQDVRDKFKGFIDSFNNRFPNERIPSPISYTPNFSTSRPEEILWWLQENTNYYGNIISNREFKGRWKLMQSKYPEALPEKLFSTYDGKPGHKPKLDITDWVAIDDLDFTAENPSYMDLMAGHYVHLDKKVGLTAADALMVIKLLRGNMKIKFPKRKN